MLCLYSLHSDAVFSVIQCYIHGIQYDYESGVSKTFLLHHTQIIMLFNYQAELNSFAMGRGKKVTFISKLCITNVVGGEVKEDE